MLAGTLALMSTLLGTGSGRATTAESGPRDITQNVFYVPLHEQEPYTSDLLGLEWAYDGPPRDAELTVDASGLDGVAVVASGADGCKPKGRPSFSCSKPLYPDSEGWNMQELGLRPATGARPGDSGTLRYTLEPKGLPAVRGSLKVIAGRPELRVNEPAAIREMTPGESFNVPMVIRNTGDVPARGVVLLMESNEDLSAATRHSNCRYTKDAGGLVQCLLPDEVIAPGETVEVSSGLRMKADRDALTERLSYGAWSFHSSGRHPGPPCCVDTPDPDLTPGRAAPLTLTRAPALGKGMRFTKTPEPVLVEVPVRNTADVEVFGTSLRGGIGSSHHIRIGFRNNGPARLEGVQTEFLVPPGTEVTESPYDPGGEDNECVPTDDGRRYTCGSEGKVGQKVFYDFTLRIKSKNTTPGCVTVAPPADDSAKTKDPEPDNDKAAVQVAENKAFSCAPSKDEDDAGPDADWPVATGIAAVATTSLLLVLGHRRRKRPASH
ncbi:hypothetical protein SGFS_058900 [Streptomyces graminofaciens]|uniref:DUF11 domain-containing protein n=1 Tax=Streptomyces graminofaciens TaxID=68212 RepID=A0ABM7FE22_9ACTN|nr:hypothetical protein SGFS_058900 [Streptomyces graminofaciens]